MAAGAISSMGSTHIAEIPDLTQRRPASILATLASLRFVIPLATAAQIRDSPVTLLQCPLEVAKRILCLVAGRDACVRQPVVCGFSAEVLDDRVEEVDDFFVLLEG
jgi:hypothetical protein